MIFQYLDYPEFQAFHRLISICKEQGKLGENELKHLTFIATEKGISKDQVRELMDMFD